MIQYFRLILLLCMAFVMLFASDTVAQTDQEKTPDGETYIIWDMPNDLQTELPQDPARAAPKPPKKRWFDLGFLAPLFKLLFWGFLAAVVLSILYVIISEIIRARKNFAPKQESEDMPEIPAYQPDAETARILLEDADKLAADGLFEQAVHMLLFRSIQDIEDKRPHHVKRSLTSREISKLSILTPKAREGFSAIGRLVENSFFGGGKLGAGDYELSKSAYKNFAYEKVAR